jgi:hypothetical protein
LVSSGHGRADRLDTGSGEGAQGAVHSLLPEIVHMVVRDVESGEPRGREMLNIPGRRPESEAGRAGILALRSFAAVHKGSFEIAQHDVAP